MIFEEITAPIIVIQRDLFLIHSLMRPDSRLMRPDSEAIFCRKRDQDGESYCEKIEGICDSQKESRRRSTVERKP